MDSVISDDTAGSEETVVLKLGSRMHIGLNLVGVNIRTLLSGEKAVSEACETRRGKYEIEPALRERDMFALLDTFLDPSLFSHAER